MKATSISMISETPAVLTGGPQSWTPLVTKKCVRPLTMVRNGEYDNVPIEIVTSKKKMVDVDKYYDSERLRPLYKSFHQKPLFIMTSD